MAPITLTRAQFAATPVGSKPGAKYGNYLSFIKARRAGTPAAAAPPAHPAAPVDPFAPTTPGQITSATNRITGMYGTPLTDPQITTAAQAQVDPLIAALTAKVTKQTGDASHAISVNSAALAKALSAIDYGEPYRGAESEQAAVDAALQQSLDGGGSALSADLKSRLGQIDDPTVAAAGDALASRGTALGTTELARGSASLSNLIANAAAAKEYGKKEPGIAGLAGLEGIAGVEKQGTSDIATQTAAILQQLPQIVQSLRAENTNIRGNRASAAEQLYETLTGQNITKATAKAGLVNDQAAAKASAASMPDPTLSRTYGYAVDQYGNAIAGKDGKPKILPGYKLDPATGQVVKTSTAKPPAAAKPLSPAALKSLNSQAHDLYNGVASKVHYDASTKKWIPVPGTGQPPVHWNAAIAQLVASGVTHDQAVKLLTAQGWQPGEGGRPQSAGQKKTNAAVKSGLGLPPDPYAAYGQ